MDGDNGGSGPGEIPVPSLAQVREMLEAREVPGNIVRHSVVVGEIALFLSTALNRAGMEVQTRAVTAAALLHDIGKMEEVEGGGDHAAIGEAWLVKRGWPGIGVLVGRHIRLPEPAWSAPHEAALLFYADKRVRHDQVVTLEERHADLVDRYGPNPRVLGHMASMMEAAARVEHEIYARIGGRPGELAGRVAQSLPLDRRLARLAE
jgi:putative nucleotidyltransferase with HDIG domain